MVFHGSPRAVKATGSHLDLPDDSLTDTIDVDLCSGKY
jgi:hypothetical protein